MRLLVMSVEEEKRDTEVESVEKGVRARLVSCRSQEELCRTIKGINGQGWEAAVLRLSCRIQMVEVVAVLRTMIFIPLLVMGSEDTYYEELQCLQQGADDYQRRETPEPIVLLRLWRLIELCGAGTQGRGMMGRHGFLELPEVEQIHYGQRDLGLTGREYQVLHWLLQDTSDVVPRRRLLALIWESEGQRESRALDTVIKQLRRKLAKTPWRIETCYGRGYRLVPVDAPFPQ